VQDDTILAYENSPHSEISCMACHMPAGADPVTFILHKAEALGELYLTVTNNFSLPLNAESEVALTMPSSQCTQCHDTALRVATPSSGILIDHAAHAEAEEEVSCAICHNRTAHVEDFDLTLKDPQTGEPNKKHEDFMEMTACFRCHSLGETPEGGLKAPGECTACHPADFELKPESHFEPGFYPEKHAELASLETSRARAATAKASAESHEATGEATAEERQHGTEDTLGPQLVDPKTLNVCYTCHTEKFCSDCHGLPMPHPEDFRKAHGAAGKKSPESCVLCHGDADTFCDECHHGSSMGVPYTADTKWITEHPATVSKVGASTCFDCHNPTYCANCHVNGPGKKK